MISVREAQEKITANHLSLEAEEIQLSESNGRILTDDIISPVDHPFFNQSAVDGYAIRSIELPENGFETKDFKITVEIKAGDTQDFEVGENEAIRIFTGAPVPSDCDTVIMQEYAINDRDILRFTKFSKQGSNIRKKGEQIHKGEVALENGETITPASIGFLASLGISQFEVSQIPKVSVIVTGNEFIRNNENLAVGKIFESNGIMLRNLLSELSIQSDYITCIDDKNVLLKATEENISKNDIVIITGGVSVGDYDFTTWVTEQLGFEIIFHKVAQKPGKPILFARRDKKVIFGLPGNPRAVFVCFYEYVYPFINKSMGKKNIFLPELKLRISKDFLKKDERALFLAGKIENNEVVILEKQDSHMLQSISQADVLIALTENKKQFIKGDIVSVHLLPIH